MVGASRPLESKAFKILTFFDPGDLGTTAKEVEGTLERNFELANRWGCILLLDEADVFFSKTNYPGLCAERSCCRSDSLEDL